MARLSESSLRVTSDSRLAEAWELVLMAEGLSPRVVRTADGMIIAVPDQQLERGLAALAAYDRENSPKPRSVDEPIGPAGFLSAVAIAAALLLFFFATVESSSTVPWFERGSADAGRIMHGEWWRAVTALTLHTDIVHVLSNAVGVVVFFGALFGILGPGLGSALALTAGAGGNLANAVLHGSSYLSVGASTAVFAAVGALGGLGMMKRRSGRHKRSWMPMAAALALLAMLGSGGERVDIWAHLLGLLIGGGIGIGIGLITSNVPKAWIQWACGSAALALLIYSWIVALN